MPEVYSSVVDTIDYDEETRELRVKWKRGGKISVYKDVPAEVARQTINAPSIGQALREGIAAGYDHSYA